MKITLNDLMAQDGFLCPECGKRHFGMMKDYVVEDGALKKIPEIVRKYGAKHPFVLCDRATYRAAGETVCDTLNAAEIPYTLHVIERETPAPDERIVGEAMMFCGNDCDMIVAVGGGVLNDTGKILAAAKNVPDMIVATAPSMDGFASASSSMERCGLKVSLSTKCPEIVLADPAILASAPAHRIRAGIGDMLAKYVSLVEWQIASVLVGETFCPFVAEIVNGALKKCREAAKAAVNGDREAVVAVMEGLVISGMTMNYVGNSRPASGMEHYISHIIDMRSLEFGTPADLHGIQAGLGTLLTVRAYEILMKQTPDEESAKKAVQNFNKNEWYAYLREKLGHGAEAIIAGEEREQKYGKEKHAERIRKIIENWEQLRKIVAQLPSSEELQAFMREIGHPVSCKEFGLDDKAIGEAFLMAKDIRDKYVLGRIIWDLFCEPEAFNAFVF